MKSRTRKALMYMASAAAAGSLVIVAAAPASAAPGVGNLYQGSPHNTFNGVWCVQIAVNVTADGNFGPQTTQGVKNFQSKRGLAVDGVVGKQTGNDIVAVDRSKGHGNCYGWVPTTY